MFRVVLPPTMMQRYTVYLYLETALHVSGGTSINHQERIHLYQTAPDICHAVITICLCQLEPNCGVFAWLLLPWTHKNAFSLYCWHTHVADNNIINSESAIREEQPCIFCIVALHMSLPTIRNARKSTCRLRYTFDRFWQDWIFSTDFRKSPKWNFTKSLLLAVALRGANR